MSQRSRREEGRRIMRHVGVAVLLAVALAACGPSAGATSSRSSTSAAPTTLSTTSSVPGSATAATPGAATDSCVVGQQAPPASTIAASFATALAFAPDGRLFYAERAGTVRVWQNGASRRFATVPTVTTESGGGYSERGLLGLAISPTFAADRFVYAFYSDPDRQHQRVIRWRDCGGTGVDAKVIINLPSGTDCCHKGGRIVFGADRMLYVSLGEEHAAAAAQDTGDVRGKILRYAPDGSVPAGNPFGAGNPVWAYGLRNPFGLAVAGNGQMAVTSNGPSGDAGSPSTGYDTLVLAVTRGAGYQWPACYGYSHQLSGPSGCAGRISPDWSSESRTVVPTGAAFIDGSGPVGLAGHLVLCTYAAGMLVVTAASPHATVGAGPSQCTLDVVESPDHAVYFSDDGHIYRRA